MTDEETMAPGEIRRGFARIEKQLDSMQLTMNTMLGPVGELRVVVANVIKDLDELGDKVRSVEQTAITRASVTEKALQAVEVRAALITGGIMTIVFVVKMMLGK